MQRPEAAQNKVDLKHTAASPDVFLQNALLWEKSISVGYAVLLARSFDLSILALCYCAGVYSKAQKRDSVLAGLQAAAESKPAIKQPGLTCRCLHHRQPEERQRDLNRSGNYKNPNFVY